MKNLVTWKINLYIKISLVIINKWIIILTAIFAKTSFITIKLVQEWNFIWIDNRLYITIYYSKKNNYPKEISNKEGVLRHSQL